MPGSTTSPDSLSLTSSSLTSSSSAPITGDSITTVATFASLTPAGRRGAELAQQTKALDAESAVEARILSALKGFYAEAPDEYRDAYIEALAVSIKKQHAELATREARYQKELEQEGWFGSSIRSVYVSWGWDEGADIQKQKDNIAADQTTLEKLQADAEQAKKIAAAKEAKDSKSRIGRQLLALNEQVGEPGEPMTFTVSGPTSFPSISEPYHLEVSRPFWLGEAVAASTPTTGTAQHIIEGPTGSNTLLVSEGRRGLVIYNKDTMAEIAVIPPGISTASMLGVTLSGTTLVTAEGIQDFAIYDLTDPSSPRFIYRDVSGTVVSATLVGRRLTTCRNDGIQIYDYDAGTETLNPQLGFTTTGQVRRSIYLQSGAVTLLVHGPSAEIIAVDSSTPATSVTALDTLSLSGVTEAYDVAVDEATGFAYVAAGTKVIRVNITDPSALAEDISYTFTGDVSAQRIAIQGKYVATASRNASGGGMVHVFDISSGAFRLIREIQTDDLARDVMFDGQKIRVAENGDISFVDLESVTFAGIPPASGDATYTVTAISAASGAGAELASDSGQVRVNTPLVVDVEGETITPSTGEISVAEDKLTRTIPLEVCTDEDTGVKYLAVNPDTGKEYSWVKAEYKLTARTSITSDASFAKYVNGHVFLIGADGLESYKVGGDGKLNFVQKLLISGVPDGFDAVQSSGVSDETHIAYTVGDTVYRVDVENNGQMTAVGSHTIPSATMRDVLIARDSVYVALGSFSEGYRVFSRSLDLRYSAAPTFAIRHLATDGETLIVTGVNGNVAKYPLSDGVAAPAPLASLDLDGSVTGAAAFGPEQSLLIPRSGGRFDIVDTRSGALISNKTITITGTGDMDSIGFNWPMAYFVVDEKVYIFDVSADPTKPGQGAYNPTLISSYSLPNAQQLAFGKDGDLLISTGPSGLDVRQPIWQLPIDATGVAKGNFPLEIQCNDEFTTFAKTLSVRLESSTTWVKPLPTLFIVPGEAVSSVIPGNTWLDENPGDVPTFALPSGIPSSLLDGVSMTPQGVFSGTVAKTITFDDVTRRVTFPAAVIDQRTAATQEQNMTIILNHPPEIDAIPPFVYAYKGVPSPITIDAFDINRDPLTISVVSLPAGLSAPSGKSDGGAVTAVISGAPEKEGLTTTTVVVCDADPKGCVSKSFELRVREDKVPLQIGPAFPVIVGHNKPVSALVPMTLFVGGNGEAVRIEFNPLPSGYSVIGNLVTGPGGGPFIASKTEKVFIPFTVFNQGGQNGLSQVMTIELEPWAYPATLARSFVGTILGSIALLYGLRWTFYNYLQPDNPYRILLKPGEKVDIPIDWGKYDPENPEWMTKAIDLETDRKPFGQPQPSRFSFFSSKKSKKYMPALYGGKDTLSDVFKIIYTRSNGTLQTHLQAAPGERHNGREFRAKLKQITSRQLLGSLSITVSSTFTPIAINGEDEVDISLGKIDCKNPRLVIETLEQESESVGLCAVMGHKIKSPPPKVLPSWLKFYLDEQGYGHLKGTPPQQYSCFKLTLEDPATGTPLRVYRVRVQERLQFKFDPRTILPDDEEVGRTDREVNSEHVPLLLPSEGGERLERYPSNVYFAEADSSITSVLKSPSSGSQTSSPPGSGSSQLTQFAYRYGGEDGTAAQDSENNECEMAEFTLG
jgi:hypothetical protein